MVLAGLLASGRLSGRALQDEQFLFLGAGEAGVGIAELIARAVRQHTGCSLRAARSRIALVDSKGLVTSSSPHLAAHKQPYAHPVPAGYDPESPDALLAAVDALRPTCLVGVSAVASAFTEAVVRAMARHTPHVPVIMALSNPTSRAECTAAQAYAWTNGACVFASGSPFEPVTLADGRTLTPGQGNNAYVFPGVGLACVSVAAKRVTDGDMLVAAEALAALVSESQLAAGCVYPPLSDLRRVSARLAAAVATNMYARGDACLAPQPEDLLAHCEAFMYNPLA